MTTLKVNAIEPEGGTTNLTVGMTGQNVAIGADSIRVNTFKDAGGNTLFTSNGSGVLSSVSGFGGDKVLITSSTVSGSSGLAFTSTYLTSTYNEYVFEYLNINPSAQDGAFTVQFSINNGAAYGINNANTYYRSQHAEGSYTGQLGYQTGADNGNTTDYVILLEDGDDDADQGGCGEFHLFNPSSTSDVKCWMSRGQNFSASGSYTAYIFDQYAAGYVNTLSVVNAINFKTDSGTFDGTIKMYGIK